MEVFMIILRKAVLLLMCFTILILSGCSSYISKEAKQKFDAREGAFSVTVYPVSVVLGSKSVHEEALTAEIIDFLIKEKLAVPVMAEGVIDIPVKWGIDQSKMAKQSAINFCEQIKGDEITTDYVLLVEILCNASETEVRGVHYFLCDKDGNLANGGLTNSHWAEFEEVKPHSRQGGLAVAKLMLSSGWQGDENGIISE